MNTAALMDENSGENILKQWLERQSGDFYLSKTEATEAAPRPTPFTYSLLKKIYSPGGPIARAYRRYGIRYAGPEPFALVGNELFVDREKELKSLLPAFSLLNRHFAPRLASFRGLSISINNLIGTARFRPAVNIGERLYRALERQTGDQVFGSALGSFLEDYELVFEANLTAAKTYKAWQAILKRSRIDPAGFFLQVKPVKNAGKGGPDQMDSRPLVGNSLEIADESRFYRRESGPDKIGWPDGRLPGLTQWKKGLLEKHYFPFILAEKNRERARWLTVKNLNALRRSVLSAAQERGFADPRNAYYLSIEEIEAGPWDEQAALGRKQEYNANANFVFPSEIRSRNSIRPERQFAGISPGCAQGRLATEAGLKTSRQTGLILYTPSLSPSLAAYFGRLNGIVSENGSYLSHLAILAREIGLPVVVLSGKSLEYRPGDMVEIDGQSGTIKKAKVG